jgi:hypothetical protein
LETGWAEQKKGQHHLTIWLGVPELHINYPMGKKFSGSVDKGYQNNQKPDIAYD